MLMQESIHTIFLAQIMGLYLFITAIIMLSRANYYRQMLTHSKAGSSTIVVTGTLGLILGLLIVGVHNVWVMHTPVLVTLVAWVLLIKSILWLALPEYMVRTTHRVYGGWGYYAMGIIMAVVGAILIIHGYYLYTKPLF